MRRLLVLLAALALAAPAVAQQPPKEPPPKAVKKLISPIPRANLAEQCRTACAQTYYFCLQQEEPQDCQRRWGQCRAGCGSLPR